MEHVEPHTFENGAKLMEHSWLKNKFVQAVEFLLLEGARWHKKPIVWAGDYADPEESTEETIYSMCGENGLKMLIDMAPQKYHYLVNYDKNEYVDKRKCPEKEGWKIHPLPLLTAEGNGRGGGDYRGSNIEMVGAWARCRLGLVKEVPEGFTEITPNFIE